MDEKETDVDERDMDVDEEIQMKIYNYMLILVLNKNQYYSVQQESMYLISLYCGISINNNYTDMSENIQLPVKVDSCNVYNNN